MECPNCGQHEFERLDYAIIQCKSCMSIFDPFVHPAFEDFVEELEDKEWDWDDDWDDLDGDGEDEEDEDD